MKCCDIHSGKLRSLIVIERKTKVADGIGGFTETWAADPAEGVWAEWTGYKGTAQFNSEELRSGRQTPINRFRVVIRHRGDAYGAPYYTEADRVVYRNRTYNIEAIIDVEDREQWLEMTVIDGRAS
jgi:SPP1 family predicted phage head-tail adaptor